MASLVYKHGSYYAVFSVNRRRSWVRLGSEITKGQAKHLLRDAEIAQTKGRLNLGDTKQVSLYQFVEEYLSFSIVNKSGATVRRERELFKTIKGYFGDTALSKISNQMVESFKAKRVRDGLKPASVNKELALLRAMLNRAYELDYLKDKPRIKLLKQPHSPRPFLSLPDARRLIECASSWLRPMLVVLLNTGIRPKELLSLRWEDIDLERRVLTIRATKTNNYRSIPMTDELYLCLTWLRDNYPMPHINESIPRTDKQRIWVFCKPDGSQSNTFRGSFNKASRKAGLSGVSPYITRHTVASHLVMQGVDLPTVAEILGHSKINTTMIYTHLTPEHTAKSINQLPWGKPDLKLVNNDIAY